MRNKRNPEVYPFSVTKLHNPMKVQYAIPGFKVSKALFRLFSFEDLIYKLTVPNSPSYLVKNNPSSLQSSMFEVSCQNPTSFICGMLAGGVQD